MAEELKACPCCHQPASPAGLKHAGCMNADCMLSGMWWKWDIWQNKRAQLPSQGGEAVAWVDADWLAQVSDARGAGCTVRRAHGTAGPGLIPLYTHPADQVAEGVVVSRELLERILECTSGSWMAKELHALLNGGRDE